MVVAIVVTGAEVARQESGVNLGLLCLAVNVTVMLLVNSGAKLLSGAAGRTSVTERARVP